MCSLVITSFRVSNIQLTNRLTLDDMPDLSIKIEIQHSINDNPDKKECNSLDVLKLYPEVQSDEGADLLNIQLEFVSTFSYEVCDSTVTSLYDATSAAAFPQIRTTLASIMTCSGIPPIFLNYSMMPKESNSSDNWDE